MLQQIWVIFLMSLLVLSLSFSFSFFSLSPLSLYLSPSRSLPLPLPSPTLFSICKTLKQSGLYGDSLVNSVADGANPGATEELSHHKNFLDELEMKLPRTNRARAHEQSSIRRHRQHRSPSADILLSSMQHACNII